MVDSKHPAGWNGIISQNGHNQVNVENRGVHPNILTRSKLPESDFRGREIGGKAGIKRTERPWLTDAQLELFQKTGKITK
jgi:hypothetical protein